MKNDAAPSADSVVTAFRNARTRGDADAVVAAFTDDPPSQHPVGSTDRQRGDRRVFDDFKTLLPVVGVSQWSVMM